MQKFFWRNFSFSAIVLAGALATISSCKKDDDDVAKVTVTSIKSEAKELAGTTVVDKVSPSADIVVTFSKVIDPTLASDFTLTPTGGSAATLTVTNTTATTVTINPSADLLTGTTYTLVISNSITATDDGKFDGLTITFKTDGLANITPPQASRQLAYFGFNNNVNSSVGSWNVTNVSSTFGTDRGGYANSSVSFNGMSDIIEVANGGALFPGPASTLSFWAWCDTTSSPVHNLFAMGINGAKGSVVEIDAKCNWFKNGASFTDAANAELGEDLFFNGDGKFKDNGGWQGHSFNTDLSAVGGVKEKLSMKWAHIVYTYDAATKLRTMYLNGVKMMQSDFNLWPAGDAKLGITGQKAFTAPSPQYTNVFAFGFICDRSATNFDAEPWGNFDLPTSNHFKGRLDDVRFFDVALTSAEVGTLYNAER